MSCDCLRYMKILTLNYKSDDHFTFGSQKYIYCFGSIIKAF